MHGFGECRPGCLHCLVLREMSRRVEHGGITGTEALRDLAAVMGEILATAPAGQAREMMSSILSRLSDVRRNVRDRTDAPAAQPLRH